MSPNELAVLLPLVALCLWLTLFLFTLLDHFVYRGTYGHFLMGLDSIQRQAGSSATGIAATTLHMRRARTRYLARYIRNAGSGRDPARFAAAEYVARVGAPTLVSRAAGSGSRRRSLQVAALYALARTAHPEALPLLEQAIASRKPVIAYAALDMLDIHGTRDAAEVLLRALEGDVLPASRIATHLEHFRIDLMELYVAWLDGGHSKSRYWIAYLLGKSRYSGRAAGILEGLLADPAADVRKVALSALAALEAPGLSAHAMRMLDDPVFFVRTQAARILSIFPEPEVVQALARKLSDEHGAVQLAVKRALVELGSVTLENLPAVVSPGDALERDTVAQITGSIRHARAASETAGAAVAGAGASHVR